MTFRNADTGAVRTNKTAPWLVFLAFALAWTLFHALTAPNRATTDVFVFRDAGCNCAAGQGLVARSVPHNQSANAELFASYTPGAPLLFAIPARIFGCRPYVDLFYNLFFAAFSAGLLLFAVLRGVSSSAVRLASAFLIGIVLPTGVISAGGDRPEAPAFCLLAILLLAWRPIRSTLAKTLLAGANGLVFLIHPFAGIVGWLLLCFLLAFARGQREVLVTRAAIALAGLVTMIAIIGACALVMWRIDPTSLRRFLQHAMGKGTGAGVVLQSHASRLDGYITAFHHVFNSRTILGGTGVIALLLAFVAIAIFVAFAAVPKKFRNYCRLQFVALGAILFGVPLVLFPGQPNYFALDCAVLLLVAVLGGFELSDFIRQSRLPVVLIGLVSLSLLPSLAIDALQNIEGRASYRHAQDQAQRIAGYFAHKGVKDPAVLVSVSDYFLYKPYFNRLYAPDYLVFPGARKDYDGLVLCYAGTQAFTHDELPWPDGLSKDGWTLIEDGRDGLRISLLGKPVMRRNWGWSCDVYASSAIANANP